MSHLDTPTGKERIKVIINALEIAANHYEYENELATAEKMNLLINAMKEENN